MKSKMDKLILILFGFFSGLTIHPVWGRVAAALVGTSFAIVLISSMSARWRFLLFFVLPVMCFLIVTYAGNGLNNWLNGNTPEEFAGDSIYYFTEAGKTAVPAVQGTTELVKTGNPDSLTNNGLKLHHFSMLLVSIFGALLSLCCAGLRKKPEELQQKQQKTRLANAA